MYGRGKVVGNMSTVEKESKLVSHNTDVLCGRPTWTPNRNLGVSLKQIHDMGTRRYVLSVDIKNNENFFF
jgi:hypothetical protein